MTPLPADRHHTEFRIADNLPIALLLTTVTTLQHIGGFLAYSQLDKSEMLIESSLMWLMRLSMVIVTLTFISSTRRRLDATALTPWQSMSLLIVASALAVTGLEGVGMLLTSGQLNFHGSTLRFLLTWNICYVSLLVVSLAHAARAQRVAQAVQATEMARLSGERDAATAHLQLLQAQVEPHFLFNALANVRRLMRIDSASARALLGDLLHYLEAALPALRDTTSTLGKELDLVRAFLAVHQVRMGARLVVKIDAPAALLGCEIPPMSLLTLVENALKHGLQPMVSGGAIHITAKSQRLDDPHNPGSQLNLKVADTGRGMGSSSGEGTGLTNLRARLKSMYGASGTLSLAVNEPHGIVVTVTLPERVA